MVSISNVSGGQAGHYYKQDNYYSKDDGQGTWSGKGAQSLGLGGAVGHGFIV